MCGVFGMLVRGGANVDKSTVTRLLVELYRLSESRGKESAGIHLYRPADGAAWTLKGAQRASELLESREYRGIVDGPLSDSFGADGKPAGALLLLAHSRLVTNGTAERPANNQPVRWGAVTMIHNGICVNVDELWKAHPELKRNAEVDTEVMAAIAASTMDRAFAPLEATREMFRRMRGAASVAWSHDRGGFVVLGTNTGDLYLADRSADGFCVFASERFILETALDRVASPAITRADVSWVAPGSGRFMDLLGNGPILNFTAQGSEPEPIVTPLNRSAKHSDLVSGEQLSPAVFTPKADESLLRYGEARMRSMRRCSRCVLPETFPMIEFDAQGVCNYCRSYRPRYENLHPEESKRAFIRSLEKYRSGNGKPDVLVAFSGGRDSSYGLHLIKHEFGLTPITFTYDWGMVTDLARRNIARICGQLGVQNILVSADIKMKRSNIRKNVSAWLKQPDLGLIPLFMAGDKHFFRVANLLKRQTGIKLDLWSANPLENTDFKSGLCGVRPDFEKKRVDYLSTARKAQLVSYYARRFLQNPRYLNSSLWDTFGAFLSYYFEPRRDFFFIFDHFVWNEKQVDDVLLPTYDWELSPDSPSTWRIGDGTAPFYNYIYMTARGFTEFDTFRSNQIREGMITRAEALERILVENRPRAMSLRWYLETLNLDFNTVVKRINDLDTLGLHR